MLPDSRARSDRFNQRSVLKTLSRLGFAAFVIYSLLRWDYHVANVIFDNVCSDNKQVGLQIYKNITLDSSFVLPLTDEFDRSEHFDYLINDQHVLDRDAFDKLYEIRRFDVEVVSSIGPVKKLISYIIRKSDGFVISKAVTVENKLGWLSRFFTLGYQVKRCPVGKPDGGNAIPEDVAIHMHLVRRTFKFQ